MDFAPLAIALKSVQEEREPWWSQGDTTTSHLQLEREQPRITQLGQIQIGH